MRTQRTAIVVLCSILSLALLGLAACGPGEQEQPEVVKPVTSQPDAGGAGAPQAGGAGAGQLDVQLPDAWVEEPPANSMRLLQASIPGDEEDGEFALFYFGPGGGGGVEQNIQRWLGQVEPAEGTQPARETFEVGDLTVHTVEAKGSITPSRMSMTAEKPEPQPGHMLLGAVVEGPGGPWFLKATGPESALGPQREAFFEMVRNLRIQQEA